MFTDLKLFGQGYVSTERFLEILTDTIKPLFFRKAPAVAQEGIKQLIGKLMIGDMSSKQKNNVEEVKSCFSLFAH